ncbi:glycosyltransferase family 4 protein [Salinimicrobium soli]|uniref:glycosyltransferase family 4 protein n=1 Tax=Salinimicrobium soli TaxID=1254399 RepID=UPI003AABCE31
MAKKVLYVVGGRSFSSSNPGRKISEVIAVWKRLNIKVEVFFGKDLISGKRESQNNYGNQSHFNSSYRKKKLLQFFIHSVSEIRDILHDLKLYKKIKNNYSHDLIWERSSRLHWAGLRLSKKLDIPFVLEWKDHLIDYKFSLFKWYALYIERKKIRSANFIVVESNVLKLQLIEQGIDANKIYVALNAVNPDEFLKDPLQAIRFKEKIGVPNADIVVGYLGSYAFYHNTELLVHAANKILKKENNVHFVLVGNGKDYDRCRELAQNYGILNNGLVLIDGVPKEEVPGILSAIDISILPGSTDIICPIKIMEYMASETAVIAPDYDCNREVINNDFNGLLFNAKSKEDLVAKIISLFSEEKRNLLALNARNYVKENLVWEQTWGKVLIDILND